MIVSLPSQQRRRSLYWAIPMLMLTIGANQASAQFGACCLGNGNCIDTNQAGCDGSSGEFLGVGTACESAVCDGACCKNNDTCTEGSADDCVMGDYQGAGSICATHCAGPLGTGFTFQGQLKHNGAPLTGMIDLEALLWTAAVGGDQVGRTLAFGGIGDNPPPINVVNGLFAVQLDFGTNAFDGDARFLELAVRSPHDPGDTEPYTTLSPRQSLTATPYALQTRGIVVDEKGNVGMGTTAPDFPLHVEAAGPTPAIFGNNTATSGTNYGVVGQASSTSGKGVLGLATATTGINYGVHGTTSSTSGTGVVGIATATSGTTYGVYSQAFSTSGAGVFGAATATTGTTYGVSGATNSPEGYAGYFTGPPGSRNYFQRNVGIGNPAPAYPLHVETSSTTRAIFGNNTATSGTNYGVYGLSTSTSGNGAFGQATATSGTTNGVYGLSTSPSGRGVFGHATALSGITHGGRFESASTSGRGVIGFATSTSGTNYGVRGHSDSTAGFDFMASGAGTDYGSSSSIRWKRNIEPIQGPLAKVARLRGVYFDWDGEHGGHHDVGMIAEEVGAVLPEIVNYEENGTDAIGLDYSKLTPLLVEAVKELKRTVEAKDAEFAAHRAEKATELAALRAEQNAVVEALRAESAALAARLQRIEKMLADDMQYSQTKADSK